MKHEIDTGLIVTLLRGRGHRVGHVIPTPDNAGWFEFEVDGNLLTLNQVHRLLEAEDQHEVFPNRSPDRPDTPVTKP